MTRLVLRALLKMLPSFVLPTTSLTLPLIAAFATVLVKKE
jgi:hypothetical protein